MKVKNIAKKKVKKIVFKMIKPFIPFILIFFALFFSVCSIIDAVFIQEVQRDTSLMSEADAELKNKCIEKAEYLNTCHNYIGEEQTKNLLDVNDREKDKEIQWSHLYAIMAFHNMSNNQKIDEHLLDEVSKSFESTFRYERDIKKIQVETTDVLGNPMTEYKEETHYILVESDTIMGHYKYNYTDSDNGKVFAGEELIGKQYERLEKYLKQHFYMTQNEIDSDIQVIIQASNGYYDGKENTSWLQANYTNKTTEQIIESSDVKASKGMFAWPIPGYTTITSHYGMRVHPITRCI